MIYPEDFYKPHWEAFMAFLLIVTCAVTPIRIAFYSKDDLLWTLINYTIDFFFFCDIIVIFNSSFYDENFVMIDDRC